MTPLLALALLIAGPDYTTSTGAVFSAVSHPAMGDAWRAPDGKVWARLALALNYVNEGQVSDGRITDSPATKACEELGARLPSHAEYQALMAFFSSGTQDGRNDFDLLFPNSGQVTFWTASALPPLSYANRARTFETEYWGVGSWAVTPLSLSVRCVL